MSIFLLLLLAKRGAADGRTSNEMDIHLDPARTTIHWRLKDVLHTVHGTFKLLRGFICIDWSTGRAEGSVDVDARSGESGSHARDEHMHKYVLEGSKYPLICFRPQKAFGQLNSASPQLIRLDGIFHIQGQDHPLEMQLHVRPNGTTYEATTHFTLPYVAWGLKDPSTFLLHVSGTVEIDVDTAAPAGP
jgi:polyisoprenoid-binding protein YceI